MKHFLQFLTASMIVFLVFSIPGKITACNIKTTFSYNVSVGCSTSSIYFSDNTDTNGVNFKAFYWSFGDGSAIDSSHYNPTHIYSPGNYTAKLTIKDKSGCSNSYSTSIKVTKFELKVNFHDTICWSAAKSAGINFAAEQQAGVSFWQWTFGDPNSGAENVANYSWSVTHRFV